MAASEPRPFRVAVIGGGTAGLATSLSLRDKWAGARTPLRLTLLEASARVGGNNLEFDGVPVFFSCFNHHNAPELRRAMEKYGLRATPCDFLSCGMLDRGADCSKAPEESCPRTDGAPVLLGREVPLDGKRLGSAEGPRPPEQRRAPARVPITRVDSRAASASWEDALLAEQFPAGVGDLLPAGLGRAAVSALTLLQEWVTFGAPVVGRATEALTVNLATKHYDRFGSGSSLPDADVADRCPLTVYELAAAINYFYSSRDSQWSRAHLEEYWRRNAGTYYYSVENGRNDLLIEAMEKDLMASDGNVSVQLLCGARCEAIEEDVGACEGRGCKQAVRVSYSKIGTCDTECSARRTTEEFDAVIVCIPPHAAARLLRAASSPGADKVSADDASDLHMPSSALSFCELFRPVHGHSCVHTDRSVFRAEGGGKALVYEVADDGSWILHIDADQYYDIPPSKRQGNVVSVWYSPDSSPVRSHHALKPQGNPRGSVDPQLVKGEFSAVLSKSQLHDRLGRRVATTSLLGCPGGPGGELEIDRVLGQGLRRYHADADTRVFLSCSYWSVEQWSQDCFRLAEEVGEAVVSKGMREAVH